MPTQISTHYVLALLILCLSFQSCRKEEVREFDYPVEMINDQLILDYFFATGSTWTYENQDGVQETVELTEGRTSITLGCPKQSCTRYQWIEQYYSGTLQGEFKHYLFSDIITLSKESSNGQEGPGICTAKKSSTFWDGLYTNYQVRNEVFDDVRQVNVAAESTSTTLLEYDTQYFWSPTIGVVKKVVNDTINGTQTWELIAYDLK